MRSLVRLLVVSLSICWKTRCVACVGLIISVQGSNVVDI